MRSFSIGPQGKTAFLGRNRARITRPHLRLANYIRPGAATPPATWTKATDVPAWSMAGNNVAGDCVLAAIAHMIGAWTYLAGGKETIFTDADVLNWYSQLTGYVPGNSSTDNGAVIQDALDWWTTKGWGGDTLAGYVSVSPTNQGQVKLATWEFGACDIGLNLPLAWQSETGPGLVWDVGRIAIGPWAPGSWGGHSVPIVSYDASGVTVVTWGGLQRMTWAALAFYCDEAWACASWDWALATGTGSGVSRSTLIADFAALGGAVLVPPVVNPCPNSPAP